MDQYEIKGKINGVIETVAISDDRLNAGIIRDALIGYNDCEYIWTDLWVELNGEKVIYDDND